MALSKNNLSKPINAKGGTRIALFPGSFDPLTHGHTDIIRRALSIFDKVIVSVLSNPDKDTLFSVKERMQIIADEFKQFGNAVEIASFSGLLVDFAAARGARILVRGLRAVSDYDYEAQMALMNRSLNSDIETLFLVAREENSYISSTLVKQVASMGADVSRYVSPAVAKVLKKKLNLQRGVENAEK